MRRPPRSPLFPSAPLFRSRLQVPGGEPAGDDVLGDVVDHPARGERGGPHGGDRVRGVEVEGEADQAHGLPQDRKSTRLNSSHANISYAVFCLKKKNTNTRT